MREPGQAASRSPDAALLDKIEQLSLLRALSDRLASARDLASACRSLVDVVWEETGAESVAYVSVDVQRRVCHLQAAAPGAASAELADDVALATVSLPAFLAADAAWLEVLPAAARRPGAALICAPMRVRGVATGLLVISMRDAGVVVEETRRLLAIVATSAALALDVARNDEREEFLATLRHDINNPINSALGYAEMIVDGLKEEGADRLVPLASSMIESLKAVADLVSNYLHMAAIDRGTPSLHLDEIDLGALAAEIVARLRPPAGDREMTLVCPTPSPRVRADRRQLGRVITNLVGNALKYTPPTGRIRVTVAEDGGGTRLAVADTGYGIAADDLTRLFTKYGRFHRGHGIPGTGLGLYLCKAIVEGHGGTITVESALGEGSTFSLYLPRMAAG